MWHFAKRTQGGADGKEEYRTGNEAEGNAGKCYACRDGIPSEVEVGSGRPDESTVTASVSLRVFAPRLRDLRTCLGTSG